MIHVRTAALLKTSWQCCFSHYYLYLHIYRMSSFHVVQILTYKLRSDREGTLYYYFKIHL